MILAYLLQLVFGQARVAVKQRCSEPGPGRAARTGERLAPLAADRGGRGGRLRPAPEGS
jgi:hypothetical protein